MKLRTRLLVLSVSTVALIVAAMSLLQLDSLTKFWLQSAAERSSATGLEVQSLLGMRISDNPSNGAGASLAETKKLWTSVVAGDKDLADALVKRAAAPSSSVVEINIIGEDGKVLVSSIPTRVGQAAPLRQSLRSILDSGAIGRLSAIARSASDWELRIPLGVEGQTQPVFDIQLLVSPILLRDKILPDVRQTILLSLFALMASVGLAAGASRIALRPVRRIGRAIDTLATGRPLGLSMPDTIQEDREVAAVEYKLSLLGEQIQGARRDADQMRTAIGSLARGVAHEIRNPLNAIALRLETLRMKVSDEVPEAEGEIDLVSHEVQRLDRVVRTFLDLSKPLHIDLTEFDAAGIAASVAEIMRPAATQAGAEVRVTGGLPVPVKADRGLIEQAVLNLVNNAIQALSGQQGGLVTVSVSHTGSNCVIAVADNGPGMPENVRDRIFEPYFTTKSSGSGIGLAFTRRTMEVHGGGVTVKSAPGAGTTMTLSFPSGGRA